MSISTPPSLIAKPLDGISIVSLCLNVPGPAALQRCLKMGARCLKLEPPAPDNGFDPNLTGDPMSAYSRIAYDAMHQGIQVIVVNLKTDTGRARLAQELVHADVLITSFRPSALPRLGISWDLLQAQFPRLSLISIVGAHGARAEEAGHDLTYIAENDLITGLELPATLYADMGGALMTSEAVLQAILLQRQTGQGQRIEVALSEAAAHLALPRTWGTLQTDTALGGAHAGYRVYRCRDGRIALAALEPHFAKRLCSAIGLTWGGPAMMQEPSTHSAIADYLAQQTRAQLDTLANQHDIPLCTLA